jgi:hypothetical protein
MQVAEPAAKRRSEKMAETMSRLAVCEKENEELRSRITWLTDQLAMWDPCFGIKQSLPSEQEAAALLRIVTGRYPHMKEQGANEKDQIQNFLCSLAFIWSLTVTKEPVTKYSGTWWIDQATAWCSTARLPGRPRTLLPAIIVSDVSFMLSSDQIFLDPYRTKGTSVDRQAWRRLLNGGDMKAAIPVKQIYDRSIGAVKVQAAW